MARASLTPQIIGSIIEYVKSHDLKKGDHLPLQMFADAFRVSRAPIISALRHLETQGAVNFEPNRGHFLAVDPESLEMRPSPEEDDAGGDDRIYFRIAEDRVSGKLNDRVSENELMRFYALPRTKLLRVLRRISEEGWMERLPGNGWTFTNTLTSKKSYDDSYSFRAVVEQQAMLLPTFQLDVEGIKKARDVQTRLGEEGYLSWSRADIFKANNDFHELLVACSQNEFFLESIKRINRLRRLIEYHVTIDRSRLPKQTSEHLTILDLVEDGRRNEAAAFLYTHIMGAGRIKTQQI